MNFGFIERADTAEMVFFHFSELSADCVDQLSVGCPVECVLQNRQGKEVATQIKILPPGSVSFDVSEHLVCLYWIQYRFVVCFRLLSNGGWGGWLSW